MAKLKWTDMEKPLSSSIYDVIKELKFEKMTPVQVSTIFPYFLCSIKKFKISGCNNSITSFL